MRTRRSAGPSSSRQQTEVGPARDSRSTGPGPGAPVDKGDSRVSALTGLRALPAALVVADHMLMGGKADLVPGVWAPMVLFFVLSGYLITRLMTEVSGRLGRLLVGEFLLGRATRLLPPLLACAALVEAYTLFRPVPLASSRIQEDLVASLLYFQDFKYAAGNVPYLGFFAHAWSLSVEAQFYVLWALLLALSARISPRLGLVIAGAGAAASTGVRLAVACLAFDFPHHFANVYYSFPVQASSLFLGAMAAFLKRDGRLSGWLASPWASSLAFAGGLAVFLCAVALTNPFERSVYLYWFVPVQLASVVMVATLSRSGSVASAVLGLPPFVWLGEISYALYLFHWPVILAVMPGKGLPYPAAQAVRIVVSLALAELSWLSIERPLQNWRRNRRQRQLLRYHPVKPVGVAEPVDALA